CLFFFSSRRRHTRSKRDWSSDVCSSDLKDKLCRTIKNKIIHCIPYLMYRLYLSKKRPNAPHFISPFSKTKIPSNAQEMPSITSRSEERRVGKEWKNTRWQKYNKKKMRTE